MEISLDQISLELLDADNVVSAINLSKSGVKIQGDKISLEGVVTMNGYFKVGLDGSIEAVNGRFSGSIAAADITGSTIKIGAFSCDEEQIKIGGFSVNNTDSGRYIITSDRGDNGSCGLSALTNSTGALWMWAGYWSGDDFDFAVNNEGWCIARHFAWLNDDGTTTNIAEYIDDAVGVAYENGYEEGFADGVASVQPVSPP